LTAINLNLPQDNRSLPPKKNIGRTAENGGLNHVSGKVVYVMRVRVVRRLFVDIGRSARAGSVGQCGGRVRADHGLFTCSVARPRHQLRLGACRRRHVRRQRIQCHPTRSVHSAAAQLYRGSQLPAPSRRHEHSGDSPDVDCQTCIKVIRKV